MKFLLNTIFTRWVDVLQNISNSIKSKSSSQSISELLQIGHQKPIAADVLFVTLICGIYRTWGFGE